MSAETTGTRDSANWQQRFRDWRHTRPFWAGLLTALGGGPIAYFPYANLKIGHLTLAMATTAGAGSLIIGVLLVTLGLTMWYHHIVRVFAGVATILLALVSIPVSNLGGFLVGFLLSMIGGCLALAWAPGIPDTGRTTAKHAAAPSPQEPGTEPQYGADPAQAAEPSHGADASESWSDGSTNGHVDANGGRNSAG